MPPRPKITPDLIKQLTKTSEPEKPKKRKRTTKPKGTGTLAQKKRTSANHNKTRPIKERTTLAHITNAIIREGGTVPDIGVILGCESSEGSSEWLDRLKTEGLSLAEFLEVAKQRADIELVRIATKTALGYEYEEETQESMPEYNESGQLTGKYLPGKKKIVKKRERDTMLLKFLLTSRMPEYFMDRKEIKIDKRVVEIKADAEAEIRSFASGLLKAFGEPIEAEFVEKGADG